MSRFGEGCVLPQQTYADPAALRESTEAKPLFAVDVRQHKGEILPHLIVRNPGRKKKNPHRLKKRPKPRESMAAAILQTIINLRKACLLCQK